MENNNTNDDRRFLHFITMLSVSAAMVGVCLTAIGLIGILESLKKMEVIVDDLLAVASLVFLTTSALSFLGMRIDRSRNWRGFIRGLDIAFCSGMALVFLSTAILAWAVI